MRLARVNVILRNVEQVAVDHPVAAHHQGAAHEREVEIRRVTRRTEVHKHGLRGDFLALFVHIGAFARPDGDRDDTNQREHRRADQPAERDTGRAVVVELGADHVAERLAGGDTGTVEAGNRTADLVGHAVGHSRHERGKHDVIAELGAAPQHENRRETVLGEGDQADGQAGDQAAEHNPRAALTEPAARHIGQRAENHVRQQRDNGTDRVDGAEHGLLGGRIDVLQHLRQDDRAQGDPRDGAGDGAEREADAEAHDLGL